jgi:hypothetical protein
MDQCAERAKRDLKLAAQQRLVYLSLSLSLRLIEAQIGVMLPRNPVIVANEAQKAPIAQKNTKHYEVRVP